MEEKPANMRYNLYICIEKTKRRKKPTIGYEEDIDMLAGHVRTDNSLWPAEF